MPSTYRKNQPPRILMSGGGTGGHVYPAIAIADAVRTIRPDAVVAFAGSRRRIEWEAVPKAGYAIHEVAARGIQRRLTAANLMVPFIAAKAAGQSWRLVEHFDADVAVGTGGYVAGPVIWAAHSRKRPVLIQEQNAHVGITNRLLSRFADRIHTAFRETLAVFPTERTVVSGNPVRPSLTVAGRKDGLRHFELEEDVRVLLVLGGSGGSLAINQAFERRIQDFLERSDCAIVWQTGGKYFERFASAIDAHPRLRIVPFIERMDLAYAAADLAICRSGALTCSELLATGTPSILIPSPNVAEDHQTRNAESMQGLGASILLPEKEMESRLIDLWNSIWIDEARLANMSRASRENAAPEAASTIAQDVLELAERRRS